LGECFRTCFEQVQRTEHVHAGVVHRILDAAAHVHLRRHMRQHVGLRRRDELRRLRIANVQFVERRVRGKILALARHEVVDHVHHPAFAQKALGEVRADESGAAGDDGRRHQR
jgi:hypothetical protein